MTYKILKRFLDLIFAIICFIIFLIPMIFIAVRIYLGSKGPIIYWSSRIGLANKVYLMPKFRTMHINTPDMATHLINEAERYLTDEGKILRKYSLDELPQIYSIFRGDMSVVGPRPALYNQHDLIRLRKESNIHMIKPGLTGWAQINGRDSISIRRKVDLDIYYINNMSLFFDIKIILITAINVILRKNIIH